MASPSWAAKRVEDDKERLYVDLSFYRGDFKCHFLIDFNQGGSRARARGDPSRSTLPAPATRSGSTCLPNRRRGHHARRQAPHTPLLVASPVRGPVSASRLTGFPYSWSYSCPGVTPLEFTQRNSRTALQTRPGAAGPRPAKLPRDRGFGAKESAACAAGCPGSYG